MVIHNSLEHAVGQSMGVFYVGDVLIRSQVLELIQGDLNILIGLIHWIGLMENIAKYKTMTCNPGKNDQEFQRKQRER